MVEIIAISLHFLFKFQVDKNLKRKNNLHESNFQAVTTIRLGWDKHLYFNPGLHKIDGRIIREDDANGAPAGREGKIISKKFLLSPYR